jgi:hypothetical protein
VSGRSILSLSVLSGPGGSLTFEHQSHLLARNSRTKYSTALLLTGAFLGPQCAVFVPTMKVLSRAKGDEDGAQVCRLS